jgi:hypothetical protein
VSGSTAALTLRARGDYFGAVLTVGRHGDVVFAEARRRGREQVRSCRATTSVLDLLVTKAFTNVLILKATEKAASLTTGPATLPDHGRPARMRRSITC